MKEMCDQYMANLASASYLLFYFQFYIYLKVLANLERKRQLYEKFNELRLIEFDLAKLRNQIEISQYI